MCLCVALQGEKAMAGLGEREIGGAGVVGGMKRKRKDVSRGGGGGIEGKTNYRPDNRQAMDFLPGHFCSSFILCLFPLSHSLSISVSPSLYQI